MVATLCVGKWHLGPDPKFWPENQGFDINVGGHNRGSPPGGYFSPYKNPRLKNLVDGEYLTDRLAEEAVDIIENYHSEIKKIAHVVPDEVIDKLEFPVTKKSKIAKMTFVSDFLPGGGVYKWSKLAIYWTFLHGRDHMT